MRMLNHYHAHYPKGHKYVPTCCQEAYVGTQWGKSPMLATSVTNHSIIKEFWKSTCWYAVGKSHILATYVPNPSFQKQDHFKRHMLIHSGEKPYACNQCPTSFQQQDHLKRHMLIHIGEKFYAFNQCPKSFNQSLILKNHMFVHCGKYPYACNLCPKSFLPKARSFQEAHADT